MKPTPEQLNATLEDILNDMSALELTGLIPGLYDQVAISLDGRARELFAERNPTQYTIHLEHLATAPASQAPKRKLQPNEMILKAAPSYFNFDVMDDLCDDFTSRLPSDLHESQTGEFCQTIDDFVKTLSEDAKHPSYMFDRHQELLRRYKRASIYVLIRWEEKS